MLEEVVIAVSHQLYGNPNNHYLDVPHQDMELSLQKSSCSFYSNFFIATNIANHFPRMIQKELSTPLPCLSSEQAPF